MQVLTVCIPIASGDGDAKLSTFTRGERTFELSNHLGNVLATITDQKDQQTSNNTTVSYYTAVVTTANGYYPFGMMMPGRRGYMLDEASGGGWSNGSSIRQNWIVDDRSEDGKHAEYKASIEIEFVDGFESDAGDEFVAYITEAGSGDGGNGSGTVSGSYRYGFNGKENDDEVKGEGNEQDYGMRIYDTRLGRFLSVDPITAQYPELTPYQFASNRPIDGIDLDGLELLKRDDNNYLLPTNRPVKDAKSVLEGIDNFCGNVLSWGWNLTGGLVGEGGKQLNNYFAGGYKEKSTTNLVGNFNQAGAQLGDYLKETSFKQKLNDLVNESTDMSNYNVLFFMNAAYKTMPKAVVKSNTPKPTVPKPTAPQLITNSNSRFPRLDTKYAEHSKTFGTSGILSKSAYYKRAISLAESEIGGNILGFTSEENTIFKLNKQTGEFIVINPDGKISTFYRRVQDPVKYLEAQKLKYGVKASE